MRGTNAARAFTCLWVVSFVLSAAFSLLALVGAVLAVHWLWVHR